MTTRLNRDEITERIQALRTTLTTMQAARLTTIRNLVDEDGRFHLRAALEAADFPQGDTKAQDAFQDFRHKVNRLAQEAGVDLELELDSRKTSPDTRYGWFTGNPVDKGLLAYAEEAAERGLEQPVPPEVRELGASRRVRVYVSFHPTSGRTVKKAADLIDKIRALLDVHTECRFDVQDSRSVGLGESEAQARDRLSAEADVRVALISPEYLAHPDERHRVLDRPGKVVAFAFSSLPDGPIDLDPLRRHDIAQLGKPWDELGRSAQRAEYAKELVRQIMLILPRGFTGTRTEADDREIWTKWPLPHRDEPRHLVPPELAETSLRESQLDPARLATTPPLRAVDRLVAWATDDQPDAPRLCALLGDVGMGKTTTANLFTQRLQALYQQDSANPMPILFDLRDVGITGLAASITLERILDSMLDATRPAGIPQERLNAQVVRRTLEYGRTVIIFDGLDEVLVHLSPHDRLLFTRQLWRALPDRSTARMLVTCRTQYFRTIRDEVNYFTGETREGMRGNDYLALLMLPFRDEQVREYLARNVDRDDDWVDRFLQTIAAVHDLPDLTRRPITLRLIADQVEFIETAKLQGRTLRSVDIYAEVVDRWISRDEGKHTLTPDHKRLLMEEIAAGLWRSGRNAWSPNEIDNWLLALLNQRPDMRIHYRDNVPDLWTADFRTATFLKREGDTFQFGHRSLFEYFLACYLFRILRDKAPPEALAMSVPSRETLEFLGQSIAGANDNDRTAVLDALHDIARRYQPKISELAFAYALHAHQHDRPHQSLTGVHLAGAELSGLHIESDQLLPMDGADLTGANLRGSIFHNVDLTGADFTNADAANAEFHNAIMRTTTWPGARAIGTILRRCDIDGADLSQGQTYRTQLLACSPAPNPAPGLLIAPIGERPTDEVRLRYFTGPTGQINAVAWSPDGTRILVGSVGGAWIWDTATGEILHNLAGQTGSVSVVAWSPDSTRILTGSNDTTARIWDATTGETLHHLEHAEQITAVAWSLDGTRILTGSIGDAARIYDAKTGETLHHLEHTRWVNVVARSPDGTRILTRIYDAKTGETLHHLEHTDWVRAVTRSPDGTRILTGANDTTTTRIYDATTGRTLHHLQHTHWVRAVAWSPDSTRIVTGSDIARICNAKTGTTVHLTQHTAPVCAVAWSPDSTRILTGSNDTTTRIYDATTGRTLHHLEHTNWVRAVAWSPDSTRIVTVSFGDAWIWDATTGETLDHLVRHTDWVRTVAWSPDSTRILTGSNDNSVRIWDATTGETLHHLQHTNPVTAAAWSPDSTRILTGTNDNTTRIWDATTGKATGLTFVFVDTTELAVCDFTTNTVVACTPGAWRWLGWSTMRDGRIDRLPAETFGELPSL